MGKCVSFSKRIGNICERFAMGHVCSRLSGRPEEELPQYNMPQPTTSLAQSDSKAAQAILAVSEADCRVTHLGVYRMQDLVKLVQFNNSDDGVPAALCGSCAAAAQHKKWAPDTGQAFVSGASVCLIRTSRSGDTVACCS